MKRKGSKTITRVYIEDDELRRMFVFLFTRRRMFDSSVSMEEGRRKKITRRVFWSFPV